jgi:hypothetical protein
VDNKPNRNALSKVYISRSIERGLKPGDLVIFYRTADRRAAYYTSVATSLGVVQEVIDGIREPLRHDFQTRLRQKSRGGSAGGYRRFWGKDQGVRSTGQDVRNRLWRHLKESHERSFALGPQAHRMPWQQIPVSRRNGASLAGYPLMKPEG